MNCYYIAAFSGGCLKCILYELLSGWNEPWIDILSFSVPVSIYLHYTAMGALSEESAITASSLSTDLWNNWTKNNAEGIAFLFCLSLLICQLGKKPNQQTKNSSKICDVSCCGAPSLGHCWICEFYLWDELISSWSLLKPLWVRAATQLGQAQQWPAEGSFNPSSVIIWRRHFKADGLGFWWQFLLLLSGAWFLSVLSTHLNVQKWEWTGTTLSDASHELLLSSFFLCCSFAFGCPGFHSPPQSAGSLPSSFVFSDWNVNSGSFTCQHLRAELCLSCQLRSWCYLRCWWCHCFGRAVRSGNEVLAGQ